MAILKLPVDSDKLKYEINTTIKGVAFWFFYRYNIRAKKWVINIYDSEKNPLITGIYVNQNSTINKWISIEDLREVDLFTIRVEE